MLPGKRGGDTPSGWEGRGKGSRGRNRDIGNMFHLKHELRDFEQGAEGEGGAFRGFRVRP
ncbi:MAG: hypothetical protein D6795_08810 [Deltaproteobacteria bacterium]|nr:MAG: hypothetical protein D6795_08810 [Deltaproteobacteria bacterium]